MGKIVKDAKFSRKNKFGEHDLYENENEQLKLSDNDKLGFWSEWSPSVHNFANSFRILWHGNS